MATTSGGRRIAIARTRTEKSAARSLLCFLLPAIRGVWPPVARLASVLLSCTLVMSIAAATSFHSFPEGACWIYMEIGHDESAVVASIRVHVPGNRVGFRLRGHAGLWQRIKECTFDLLD